MNSRGDALEYQRSEQIGLESKVQGMDGASISVVSKSSGFDGSVEQDLQSESFEILDNRTGVRVSEKPSYIVEMNQCC